MKTQRLLLQTLLLLMASQVFATETLEWKRLPLSVALAVGQERVIFVDHDVRVGLAAELADQLRVQSAAGAVYLRASAPFEAARLQLEDAKGGQLIMIDVSAREAAKDAPPLEPVRIVFAEDHAGSSRDSDSTTEKATPLTPKSVLLTRYAAQSLYAPLRTVETVPGMARVPLPRRMTLDTLFPGLPIVAKPLAAWRLDNQWVTAVLLTNVSSQGQVLDPRTLQGDFVAATFQHHILGPAHKPSDTTVLYLVTRGHGLAESLLPVISPIDAATHLHRDGQNP